MLQNLYSYIPSIFKKRRLCGGCESCGSSSNRSCGRRSSCIYDEPPYKRVRYNPGLPNQRLDHLIPNCLVQEVTLRNLRCQLNKSREQEVQCNRDQCTPLPSQLNLRSCQDDCQIASSSSLQCASMCDVDTQCNDTNFYECNFDCNENSVCPPIQSTGFCNSTAISSIRPNICSTNKAKSKRKRDCNLQYPSEINFNCQENSTTCPIDPCTTKSSTCSIDPCTSKSTTCPVDCPSRKSTCQMDRCAVQSITPTIDLCSVPAIVNQCESDMMCTTLDDQKAFQIFKEHLNSMLMDEEYNDACSSSSNSRRRNCHNVKCKTVNEKPEDLWAKMQISQKLPYYWLAIKQSRPSTIPYENFKKFYESSGHIKVQSLRLRCKWDKMDYSQRLPFILESFLAKITEEKIDCLDEDSMRNYFSEHRRKSLRKC